MNEELRNDLVEVEMNEELEEEFEESNGIFGKVAVGIGVVAIGVATTLVVKNRDKIKAKLEERKIRKLEDKGYVIYKPEEVVESEEVESEEEEK